MKRYFWTFENQTYWWREYEFKIFYSYLFRFMIKNDLEILGKSEIVLKGEYLQLINDFVQLLLKDLIKDCHSEPNQKALSKHGSSYEKIIIEGVIYHVNYRISDQIGSVIFSFYTFSKYLEIAFKDQKKIVIQID